MEIDEIKLCAVTVGLSAFRLGQHIGLSDKASIGFSQARPAA